MFILFICELWEKFDTRLVHLGKLATLTAGGFASVALG